MPTESERLRKLFPHLAKEIEEEASTMHIDEYRVDAERDGRLTERRWAGYNPDVVDFIRRCQMAEQAEEIIGYMEKRGEISTEEAEGLRKQLREKGLGSFGERKEPGFYHRGP